MKFWKVLAGLGVAAAAAGVAVAVAKKQDEEAAKAAEEFDFENELDEILEEEECCCGECDCEDCDCDDCDDCVFFDEDEDDDDKTVDLTAAVNSVVDGVMGGIVVAADKVSELCGKLADVVSNKLVERQESRLFEDDFDLDDIDFDECDCDDECCCDECDCAPVEEAVVVVVETAEDASEAIHEAVEATEE